MTFVNNCTPEPEVAEDELYGPDPYDLNFVFPIPSALSTVKLRLVSFVPRLHAASFLDGIRGHESEFKYMPLALEHPADFLRNTEKSRRDKHRTVFAAIDTTHPDPDHPEWEGSFAGLFGSVNADAHFSIGISPIIVLPAFQRTHISSHAIGLLLKYIFELPPAGLGLRRAWWSASPMNTRSNNLAKRMGFKLEGVARWRCTLENVDGYEKLGEEARKGDAGNGLLGRDSNEWAMCWDDWEGGGRELVERAFAREA